MADSLDENTAPMQGPNKKPSEKAIPTSAMAEDLVSGVVRSVMIAILNDTFDLETPPMIRLSRNIINTLDMDHTMYETKVPVYLVK